MDKQPDLFLELEETIKHGNEVLQNAINRKVQGVRWVGKAPRRGRYSGLSKTPFGSYENR